MKFPLLRVTLGGITIGIGSLTPPIVGIPLYALGGAVIAKSVYDYIKDEDDDFRRLNGI